MKDCVSSRGEEIAQADARRRALWARLVRFNRAVCTDLRDTLRRCSDMTLPQFEVLSALSEAPAGLKMSALSTALQVSNGNVTGIVERLVKLGLVQRTDVPGDRRATLVRLTGCGARVQADLAAQHDATLGLSLRGLDPEAAETIIALLDATRAGRVCAPPPAPL